MTMPHDVSDIRDEFFSRAEEQSDFIVRHIVLQETMDIVPVYTYMINLIIREYEF